MFQEHQASHIMASAILEIIGRVCGEQPEGGPLALGATVEGDPYVLSSLLAELVLREMSFCASQSGRQSPPAIAGSRDCLVQAHAGLPLDQLFFAIEISSFVIISRSTRLPHGWVPR